MSAAPKNGGPAFPNLGYNADQNYNGMTLRDWFAGQALAGECARTASSEMFPQNAAVAAYKIADAMLAEREKGGQ